MSYENGKRESTNALDQIWSLVGGGLLGQKSKLTPKRKDNVEIVPSSIVFIRNQKPRGFLEGGNFIRAQYWLVIFPILFPFFNLGTFMTHSQNAMILPSGFAVIFVFVFVVAVVVVVVVVVAVVVFQG